MKGATNFNHSPPTPRSGRRAHVFAEVKYQWDLINFQAVPPAPSSPAADPDKIYLEDASTRIVASHNTIASPSTQAYLHGIAAPDFQMIDDSIHECPLPASTGISQLISDLVALRTAYPDFFITVESACAEIKGRFAVVWVTTKSHAEASGNPLAALNREAVCVLSFRRRSMASNWVWYKHQSIRGGGALQPTTKWFMLPNVPRKS
jgi:hypothetical protein